MWKLGLMPRDIPFLGIFVSSFRHFVFAVQYWYQVKKVGAGYAYACSIKSCIRPAVRQASGIY
jgi:hypothetical protein